MTRSGSLTVTLFLAWSFPVFLPIKEECYSYAPLQLKATREQTKEESKNVLYSAFSTRRAKHASSDADRFGELK